MAMPSTFTMVTGSDPLSSKLAQFRFEFKFSLELSISFVVTFCKLTSLLALLAVDLFEFVCKSTLLYDESW